MVAHISVMLLLRVHYSSDLVAMPRCLSIEIVLVKSQVTWLSIEDSGEVLSNIIVGCISIRVSLARRDELASDHDRLYCLRWL